MGGWARSIRQQLAGICDDYEITENEKIINIRRNNRE